MPFGALPLAHGWPICGTQVGPRLQEDWHLVRGADSLFRASPRATGADAARARPMRVSEPVRSGK